MGVDYRNIIGVSGPTTALENFAKFCNHYYTIYGGSLKSDGNVYSFSTHNSHGLCEFKILTSLFPSLNMYYFCCSDGDFTFGKSHVDGKKRSYNARYYNKRNRTFEGTKETDDEVPILPLVFPDEPSLSDFPKEFLVFSEFTEMSLVKCRNNLTQLWRRKFLNENPVMLAQQSGLDCIDLITILLRPDSLEIIRKLVRLGITCDRSTSFTMDASPILVALRLHKFDEFNLLKRYYPETPTRLNIVNMLSFSIQAHDEKLFRELYKAYSGYVDDKAHLETCITDYMEEYDFFFDI